MKMLIILGLMVIGCVNSVAGILATPTLSINLGTETAHETPVQLEPAPVLTEHEKIIQGILEAIRKGKNTSKVTWGHRQVPECGEEGLLVGNLTKTKGLPVEWEITLDPVIDCLYIKDFKSGEEFYDLGRKGILSRGEIFSQKDSVASNPNGVPHFKENPIHWEKRYKEVLNSLRRALEIKP